MILNEANESNIAATLSPEAETAFYVMAESMGLIATETEAAALARFDEVAGENLTEAQNIVRLNRQAKLSSLTVRSALLIAQQRKDPVFVKYARASAVKRKLRDVLVKKYGAQAGTTARKMLANAGKRNMVDISQKPSSFSNPATNHA